MTQQNFQPEPEFAVTALQQQVTDLRSKAQAAEDHVVYLTACLQQIQAKNNQEISRLKSEIDLLKDASSEGASEGS